MEETIMDLYVKERGIDLLKKTELILNAILDEKKMDESYKRRVKKKIAINLQILLILFFVKRNVFLSSLIISLDNSSVFLTKTFARSNESKASSLPISI